MLYYILSIKLSLFPPLKSPNWWFVSTTAVQLDVFAPCFGFPMHDLCSVLKFSASQQSLFFHFFVFPLSLIPATNLLSAAISEGRHQLLSSPSILWAPRATASRYTKRHDDLLQMSGVAPLAPRGLGGTGCSWITRDTQRRIGNFSSQYISPQGKGHLP